MKKPKSPSRKTHTPKVKAAVKPTVRGGRRVTRARMASEGAESDGSAPVPKPRRKAPAKKKEAAAAALAPAAKKAAPATRKAAAARPRKPVAPRAAAKAAERAPESRPTRTRARKAVALPAPAVESAARAAAPRTATFQVTAPSPARHFDDGRFLFPRTYEVSRVRLVVRDPEWLFAYWDVNPRAFDSIRQELGERVAALSRLTLKVQDPDGSTSEVILLPAGARSWYLRIDASRGRYCAEIGITLPSGQFRALARSNVVALPRSGPSTQGSVRSVDYREAWRETGLLATGVEADEEPSLTASSWPDAGGSMRLPLEGASDRLTAERQGRRGGAPSPGGASDVFRR